nr:MAG TPA: hypothetical protein [Caudoviricetes sp.]
MNRIYFLFFTLQSYITSHSSYYRSIATRL